MANLQKHFHVLLLLPCLLTICSANNTTTTNITTDELALLALRARITEPPSRQTLAKNWTQGSSVCSWIGVTCGSRHLRVTALELSGMNLSGTIPPLLGNLSYLVSLNLSRNNLNGGLPDELARFRRLKSLDLSFNNLSGQFPTWIGSLQELEYLSLWNNSFTGVIPQSISNVSKLTTLIATNNHLQGTFPTEIFNISSLERISLGSNGFSGGSLLPDSLCQNLPMLKRLDLPGAGFIGRIPSGIGQCLQLQRLDLSSNSLHGVIPTGIGNLKELQLLNLGFSQLEGAIPKEIGNLSMLQWVSFNTNNITGVIPEEIGKLSNLRVLSFGNNKLTGSVSEQIFNISTLTWIDFEDNQLSGHLPSTMGTTLPNLGNLHLGGNNFGGIIPNSISNCSGLLVLQLQRNNFSGPVPNSLGDLNSIECVHLYGNKLTRDPSSQVLNFITSLVACKQLTDLSLDDNPFDGILPDLVGNISSSLQRVYASNCKISGIVPEWFGNLSSLHTLVLADNNFTGSLSSSMKNMQNLQRLELRGNKMSIPLKVFCGMPNLGDLSLGGNSIIGGAIPDCLGFVPSLRYLNLSSTGLNSILPVSLWNLKDLLGLNLSSNMLRGALLPEIKNLRMATWMDFSHNAFSGDIPNTIGELEALQIISLAHNQLQGNIPETVGGMLNLEQLDLSYNLLSGTLPMSLEKLQHLTFFNVSYNSLSGEIPSRAPFTNFSAESFMSNKGLCGAKRFHVPSCPNPKRKRHIILIISVVAVSVASIACLLFTYLMYRRKGKPISDEQKGFPMVNQERISFYKLLEATEGYSQSNLLGSGSFGSVHKGTLEDGRIVAVKVFDSKLEGSFSSFDTECEILRNLRHRNLTKVISSCSTPDFKALVLEYMPNGSLEKWLYSNKHFLNLIQRLDILINVASALQYLHCGNPTPIVHCDLKPSNVLLDQDMVAHVSDFGMAKLLGNEDCFTYTKTLATLCYLAPEYASEGIVSTRCDIYSFGIMMMEVFTRKSPMDKMFGENLSLKSWVQDCMPDKVADVIDVDLLSTFDNHFPEILAAITSIMEVALSCANASPRERSTIDDVHASLNKIRLRLLQYADGLGGTEDSSKN